MKFSLRARYICLDVLWVWFLVLSMFVYGVSQSRAQIFSPYIEGAGVMQRPILVRCIDIHEYVDVWQQKGE